MNILNGIRSVGHIVTVSAQAYKSTLETSVAAIRGTAECAAAAGSACTQIIRQPKEILKSCLGINDFRQSYHSLTTPEITTTIGGRQRTIRRPIPERIGDASGLAMRAVSKIWMSILGVKLGKLYAIGTYENFAARAQPITPAQVFTNAVNGSMQGTMTGIRFIANGCFAIGQSFANHTDLYLRAGATGACLYGTSYGIVHAAASDNFLGKITNIAVAGLCLTGAYYTSGLSQVFVG